MTDWLFEIGGHWGRTYILEFGRYVAAAGVLSLLLFALGNWAGDRRIQERRATLVDRARELFNSVKSAAIFAVSGVAIFLLNRAGLADISGDSPSIWQGAVEFAALVVAHDAYFYWTHRAMHTRALFLRAHATHHRSRTPTPWAAYSFAPLEAILEALYLPLILLLVPVHVTSILAYAVHQIARNVMGHAGHELMPSGFTRHWLGRWFTTTTHHDLHHSGVRYNFGIYFTWWDRLMGTEHPDYHARFEEVVKRKVRDLA